MNLSEQRNLTKKQMLQDMATQMSASVRADIRNFIDELGLTLVNVSRSTSNVIAL